MLAWNDTFPPLNLWNYRQQGMIDDQAKINEDYYQWIAKQMGIEKTEIDKEWEKHHMDKYQGQTSPVYKNKREEVLTEAMHIVSGARADAYGGPEDSFTTIADLWAAYCGRLFTTDEVAIMLALLKIARLRKSPTHKDSWVDLAGYAACGAECALK